MSDLRQDLASLRIDHHEPARTSRGRWPIVVLALVALAGAAWWLTQTRAAAVQTVQPTVSSPATRTAGAPLLSASGYVVARREAALWASLPSRSLLN